MSPLLTASTGQICLAAVSTLVSVSDLLSRGAHCRTTIARNESDSALVDVRDVKFLPDTSLGDLQCVRWCRFLRPTGVRELVLFPLRRPESRDRTPGDVEEMNVC